MKNTELRIGNLISRKDLGNGEDRIESVIELGQKLICSGPIKVICQYDEIQPIPLTEEWLLKFGFEKLNRDVPAYESNNLIMEWLFERWTGRLYYDAYTSIQIIQVNHVHQLQNLYFALTGEELILT